MADKKIRVGIIGTGGIANAHMDQYTKFDDVEIVCGADIVPGKAKAFFERWGVEAKAYENHKEMLDSEELDVVSVCTYTRQHAVCTIDALEHGLDVLLEKPSQEVQRLGEGVQFYNPAEGFHQLELCSCSRTMFYSNL